MTEQLTVTTERVDDIPVLIASLERIGMAELADEHFKPHGNWQGISLGTMLTGWLAHILSEADHRLNQVQDWAARRLETLSGCLDGFWVNATGFRVNVGDDWHCSGGHRRGGKGPTNGKNTGRRGCSNRQPNKVGMHLIYDLGPS